MGAGGFHPSTGDRVLPTVPGSDWEGGPNRKTDGTQRLSMAILKARLLAAALPDLLRCRFGVPTEIQRRSGAEARALRRGFSIWRMEMETGGSRLPTPAGDD